METTIPRAKSRGTFYRNKKPAVFGLFLTLFAGLVKIEESCHIFYMVRNKQKKVFVAMSGGVDSSVAAALLKKQGYDVVGVFMLFQTQIYADEKADERRYEKTQMHADKKVDSRGLNLQHGSACSSALFCDKYGDDKKDTSFFTESYKIENRCCSEKAYEDAKKVAAKLGIPLYTFNLEKEFKKAVVDYFVEEYAAGRTPNPCVMCNKEIKFRLFLDKALAIGANMIATGHYARIKNQESRIKNANKQVNKFVNSQPIRYSLMAARDKNKDQSYFLWTLGQERLKHILFPIGDYTKPQVRRMARKFGLPVSEKKDSQEVCFTNTNLSEFLGKRIKTNRGPIITTDGDKVGEHKGLAFYTIGQRKGIEIGGIGPFYVVEKNYRTNSLIVASGRDNKALYKKELIAGNVNWINEREPELPIKIKAKIRYRHEAAAAVITQIYADEKADDAKRHPERSRGISLYSRRYCVIFDKPQGAITPGQSVVFYKGGEMLGGGVVES